MADRPEGAPVAKVQTTLFGVARTLDVHRLGFGKARIICGAAEFDLTRDAAFDLIDGLLDAAALTEMEAHACEVVTETLGPL